MAVLTQKHPERISDLLGYRHLIITASLEYEGDNWLGYDRQFRLTAAATQNTTWGHVDQTLWSLAFSTKAKTTRCQYCFSINHKAAECGWAPEHSMSNPTIPTPLFHSGVLIQFASNGIAHQGDAQLVVVHTTIYTSTVPTIPMCWINATRVSTVPIMQPDNKPLIKLI